MKTDKYFTKTNFKTFLISILGGFAAIKINNSVAAVAKATRGV